MKKLTLVIIAVMIAVISFGQSKKDMVISFSAGKLTSPYYPGDVAQGFLNLDLDYHLTERQMLSSGFLAGGHRYFDNSSTNYYSVSHGDTTNINVTYRIFSVLYKYRIINTKAFSMAIGTGAGIMTQTRQYYFTTPTSIFPIDTTWTDLVFPVRLEADYKLSRHLRLGLIGGFFVHPDYPILAYHAGVRVGYVIK